MDKPLNRRQFSQGLVAGAALTIAATGNPSDAEISEARLLDAEWRIAAPGVWKATLGSPEMVSPVNSRLLPAATAAMRSLPAAETPALGVPKFSLTDRGMTLGLPLAPYERIYGFGLQFFSLDHRGKKCTVRVNADPVRDTGDSHAPVPFYVSSRGYGILVDTARYASFYCGDSRSKPQKASTVRPSGVDPVYTKTLKDEDASQVLVDVPVANGVDVYLFSGPTMLDVVRRYNLFSGGGVLPPEWGLGFWYRVASGSAERDVATIAAEFRERNIPCDVLGLEAGWHSHAYSCTYVWNEERFPHPERSLQDLIAKHFHINLWEHAFIHPSSPLFEPMLNLSGDKAVWGGLVPDFYNPQARRVFGEFHGKNLIDIGVSGFKLDECDNSDFTGGWSFAELSRFPSGVDGEQMHSLFGLRYQDALWKAFAEHGKETYSLVRSSGALAAPYPFVLYSDLYDHRQFVRALLNASFSGLLWCPEVRDARSEEDYLRRLQTVVFSPLAMINGWYIANPPWKQLDRKKNNANEFSANWREMEERSREIIGWRMQFIPYLRAAFARYAADGPPPFRAPVMDWPDAPELAATDDAWMVGDRLLVAPLFAGEPQGRTLFLPSGQWFNFWTGESLLGGSRITLPASTRNIPVFVKSGAVLPLAPVTSSTADTARRNLEVRVYGDGSMPFRLETSAGSAIVAWNAVSRSGSIAQAGDEKYTVSKWLQVGGTSNATA
jgi:alpha-D-xyloside xylohydrolase